MPVLTPPRFVTQESLSSGHVSVLAVTWQHPFTRKISAIGILSLDTDGCYRFEYVKNVLTIEDFQPLIGFPDLFENYQSDHLFPLFAQRVMDPRRPDYVRYVNALGISESSTPWEQLSHSGGRRTGDTLQLLPVPVPADDQPGIWEVKFLVHGMRYIAERKRYLNASEVSVTHEEFEQALQALKPGSHLQLIPEPTNPVNDLAYVVTNSNGLPLGYLPDVFTEDVDQLGVENVSCTAEIVNSLKAPWHMRLVAKLRCKAPEGFHFFSSEAWQPTSSS